MPRSTREDASKVHISHKHVTDLRGRNSPGPGAYTPQRLKKSPSASFGTSKRPASAGAVSRDSGAMLANIPSPQAELKRRPSSAVMGTASRDVVPLSPDLCLNGVSGESPGPARYKVRTNPASRSSPSFTMGSKTPVAESKPQTTRRVGPGTYPVHSPPHQDVQSKHRGRGPHYSVPKQARWRLDRNYCDDNARLWDGTGARKLQFQRNFSAAPTVIFDRQTRDGQRKKGVMMTPSDQGPKGDMPAMHIDSPSIPPRLSQTLTPHNDPVSRMPGTGDR